MSIYTDNGYSNRKDYLRQVSENYGIEYYTLLELAELMGETEDFDGLISTIEDMGFN